MRRCTRLHSNSIPVDGSASFHVSPALSRKQKAFNPLEGAGAWDSDKLTHWNAREELSVAGPNGPMIKLLV